MSERRETPPTNLTQVSSSSETPPGFDESELEKFIEDTLDYCWPKTSFTMDRKNVAYWMREAISAWTKWKAVEREKTLPQVASTPNGVIEAAEQHADRNWTRKVGSYPNREWVRDFESFVKGADFVITQNPTKVFQLTSSGESDSHARCHENLMEMSKACGEAEKRIAELEAAADKALRLLDYGSVDDRKPEEVPREALAKKGQT